ncbi:MAG: hypothetical protein M4D80_14705 [Myxococcota bacterium]|nr:hypothetical protein [Myxococcota bacterium]
MLRLVPTIATLLALHADARAECVAISGSDDELVRAIAALLDARGVEVDPACTGSRASVHLEQRGDVFAITVDGHIERSVSELETAATVIESFVRDDGAPLLPIRPHVSAPIVVVREPVAAAPPAPSASRGIQVFAAAETSLGSDHTNWLGAHVGICITLGPICAAARLRSASVVAGEGMWRTEMERRTTELLLGLDIPFALGRTTLSPGFAAGMGNTWTRSDDGTTAGETGGLRADVHATLTVPLTNRWSLDLSFALDLTQETRIESDTMSSIPDEPLALLRFGVGMRWAK